MAISCLRKFHNTCEREHAYSFVGTHWGPPRVPFNECRRLLLFRVTPRADIDAVVKRKTSALACNRKGISLRLSHSLFIMLKEVLRLHLNLCIIRTDFFLLSRICEFVAESCDFYYNILFPGLNLV